MSWNDELNKLIHKWDFARNILRILANLSQFQSLSYYKDQDVMRLLRAIYKETDCQMNVNETYLEFSLARPKSRYDGDMAEVGVYQGSSAKLICEAKASKPLHLFDSFKGLPQVQKIDSMFRTGQFQSSFDAVHHYLSRYDNVYIYEGIFSETSKHVSDRTFSFVHIDVDIYKSTLQCCQFFYPRMKPAGIILLHDYAQACGVRKAFSEFLRDKPEPIIELAESQCLLVKA